MTPVTAIFISHRSCDNAEAEALKGWLAEKGHERLFLDFDPADGIPAGVDWEQRLYQELRRCQALLIVLTPAWLESKWCGNELAIAREKGKAVFVVRVKPGTDGSLIPALQEVNLTGDRAAALEKLARGLKEHGLDPRDAFDWKPDRPIYPGLAAFDVEDAAIFFGRSEESWQIIETLRRMRLQATGAPKLLLITGASGSGKSSLMRAGVLARLGKEPASWITARPFRRRADALGALADALAWAFPPDRRPTSLEAVTARLTGPDGAGQLLALTRELRLALDRPEATLVLALDQTEELLAAERGDDAAKLLDLFRATLAVVGNEILAIATIRSDRLGSWQQHGSIKATAEHGELPFEMLPLGPMPMARIGEIVRGPAAYEGLRINDDLVDAIRADTVTSDALPLLAYTLQYLHGHFSSDGRLTLADYRSFGGLEGSVRNQADAAIPIDQLSEEDRRALQEAFVPGLVRATAEGGFSRSRALLATLPPRAEPYLRRLIDEARLLTTAGDPQVGVTVEVAHESLLRVWPTLVRWIAEDAESLRRLEAMQRAALDWAQARRGEDFLVHRDHRLSDAELLIAEPRFAARLDNPDRDYIAACRNAQNQREAAEKEAQERELRAARELNEEQKAKTRRTLVGFVVACMLFVVAAGLGWWALDRAEEAKRQSQEATKQKEETEHQLDRANKALATSLWNDLDFADQDLLAPAERKALWTLAMDGGLVRAPFVAELSADTERMQRFARRPETVARALGLGWPSPEETQAALSRAVTAIADTTNPDQRSALARAVRTLAGNLSAEQAGDALDRTLAALTASRDPWELRALAQVVQALPVQLTAKQAEVALTPILQEIEGAIGPSRRRVEAGTVEALANAVRALAGKLVAEHARYALVSVLKLMAGSMAGPNSPDDLRALAEAVQALPVPLDATQAQAAVGPVLDAINGTKDPDQIRVLAQAVRALVKKLSVEQAEVTLGSILDAIKGTNDPSALGALAGVVQALPVPLTAAQSRDSMAKLLNTIAGTTDAGEAWGLALTEVVQGLTAKLTAEQANDALGSVLDAIKGTADYGQGRALTATAQALAGKLTAERIRDALGAVLEALEGATEYDRFLILVWTAQGLAGSLSAEQVRDASAPVLTVLARTPWKLETLAEALAVPVSAEQILSALATIEGATNASEIQVLAQAEQAQLVRPTTQQASNALGPLLDAIRLATPVVSLTSDSEQLWVLAQAMRLLSVQLTSEQASEALKIVLTALVRQTGSHTQALAKAVEALAGRLDGAQAQTALGLVLTAIGSALNPDEVQTLAEAVQALAGKLDDTQVQAAFGRVFDDIKNATDLDQILALDEAVKALPGQLAVAQAPAAVAIVRPRLAWAKTSDDATSWARALVTPLPRANPGFSVAEIVKALQYPTSAGPATDVLLDGLHGIDPRAPGKEAGLAANLVWLSTAYPAIDLHTPPACPKPLSDQQDVACPVGST